MSIFFVCALLLVSRSFGFALIGLRSAAVSWLSFNCSCFGVALLGFRSAVSCFRLTCFPGGLVLLDLHQRGHSTSAVLLRRWRDLGEGTRCQCCQQRYSRFIDKTWATPNNFDSHRAFTFSF
jgi:hypothetical protein